MKTKHIVIASVMAAPLLLASCASKKIVADNATTTTTATTTQTAGGNAQAGAQTGTQAVASLAFMQQVADNEVYARNIVGNMSFNLKAGSKDITVPGSLRMRKDEVIRLQLFIPILGTEVGRLEFTPSYVLVVDRMHKEYIKASYDEVDFLKRNGISFYSLQALFWNQLFAPGEKKMGRDALKKFTVQPGPSSSAVTVSQSRGNMHMSWVADSQTGRIDKATVAYKSAQHGESTLLWQYGGFKAVGVKQFPSQQTFSFSTTATNKVPTVQVSIKMNDVKTSADWDATTEISSRYKQIDAADVLQKLLNIG